MEIKPIKTKDYGSGFSLVDTDLLNQLQADYKAAIEAFILVMDERFTGLRKSTTGQLAIKIIEKAYGEKWEDIRREK